ncbi:hypothetical protein [Streptomyces sp. NPDC015130]|uniref:hypothetical protein n=1 Tax=Streptomyces sp. NPDC015130 TaxID=3364940 RepID=UPI0036F74852
MAALEYDELDPLLVAAIEDMFAAIHPLDLVDEVRTSVVPEAAEKAFADLVLSTIPDDDETVDGWDEEQQ